MSAFKKIDFLLLFSFCVLGTILGFVFFIVAFGIMNAMPNFTILCWDFSYAPLQLAIINFNKSLPGNALIRIGVWFIIGIFTSFSLWVGCLQSICFLKKATPDKELLEKLKTSCQFAYCAWLTFAILVGLIISMSLLA